MRVLASLMAIGLLAAGYPHAQEVTQVRLGTVIPAGTIWNTILKLSLIHI